MRETLRQMFYQEAIDKIRGEHDFTTLMSFYYKKFIGSGGQAFRFRLVAFSTRRERYNMLKHFWIYKRDEQWFGDLCEKYGCSFWDFRELLRDDLIRYHEAYKLPDKCSTMEEFMDYYNAFTQAEMKHGGAQSYKAIGEMQRFLSNRCYWHRDGNKE